MRSLIVSTLVALPLALGLSACDSGDGGSDDTTSTGSGTEGSGTAADSGTEGGEGSAEGSSTAGDSGSSTAGDSGSSTAGDSGSSTAGDSGSDSSTAGDTTAGDTGGDDQTLCESTEGKWEPSSCGHYSCGAPPECAAVIPGCDCGKDSNFVEGVGCQVDESCDSTSTTAGSDPAGLCEGSGGTWDEDSCGHYKCGEFPACYAIIPGCDCGAGASYQEGFGCKEDSTCP